MPRGISPERAARQSEARTKLDDTVAAALAEVTASEAKSVAYRDELVRVDEAIQQLRFERCELHRQREAHRAAHFDLRQSSFMRVYQLCKEADMTANEMLKVAVQLELGEGERDAALAAGREILRALDGEPLLVCGYVFLARYGLWYGGSVRRRPYVELLQGGTGQFVITVPVRCKGVNDLCHVPIDGLAREPSITNASVGIGEEAIAGMLQRHLSNEHERQSLEHIRAALADAELDPSLCDRFLAAANA